jgi:ElaB/YqjD/DUF883 family membrane-anchored ribosome-binding protein
MSNQERSAHAPQAARAATDGIAATGAAAYRDAIASVEGAVSDAGDKGREALQSARDVRDTFADALMDSLETHPYTTLAIVGGIGFVMGAMWRR